MNNELVKQTFDLAAPQEAMKVAGELQRFVTEKKLTANIKGKNYPLVEAWQFAGSQLGLYPLLIDTKDLSNGNELKYMATVEVFCSTSVFLSCARSYQRRKSTYKQSRFYY